MRLILKFFGQKFWLKNSFSKSTLNDPKCEKRSPVLPIGRPAGPSGGPNLTGDRFFHLLDHLELIWKFFFQPKSFDQKKPFNWIFDNRWRHHAVNSYIFLSFFWSKILVEIFFSKSTPNDPKREKTWKKNRRTNCRFCRPDRPADRIWPFFPVEHVK